MRGARRAPRPRGGTAGPGVGPPGDAVLVHEPPQFLDGIRQTPPAAARVLQRLVGKFQRAAVVGAQQEKPQQGRRIPLQQRIDADHVSQRFGHLLRFHVDQAVVHPIADEWRLARIRFRLRNFVFVVRKHQIQAAAVEVDVISQVFEGHGRALDVPSRAALPPGALPRRLARFGRFPQGEVHRIAFAFIGFETGARHQLVETLSAQSAVIGKARHVEKDVPVHGVGEAFFHQRLDHLDDVGNMLAHPRIMVRILNAQPPHGGQILVGEAGRQPERILSFGARSVDDLVVHVGEVLHQRDTIAPRPREICEPPTRSASAGHGRCALRRKA